MKRTIVYSLLVSLVLVTPFIYSDELYNGLITAKQIWFYRSMGLLILVFAFDQLFNRKKLILRLNKIDIVLLLFYIYYFIRAALTPYTPILYNTRFVNLSLVVILYFIIKVIVISEKSHSIVTQLPLNYQSRKTEDGSRKLKNKTGLFGLRSSDSRLFIPIIIHFLIISGLVQAIWGLLQLYGITRSFHSGFKITGTFFNPAPYALYLAAIFPLALGRLLLIKELKNEKIKELMNSQFLHFLIPSLLINKLTYYISLLTIISIILVLPATMNRASWLGVTIGSLFVLNYKYDLLNRTKLYLHSAFRRLLAIAVISLLIVLSGVVLYHLKKGSSVGKLLIWEVTSGKIAKKPIFGYGVGRFEAEYNNWQADYFQSHPEEMDGPKGMVAGNTKYCFNEYLEMAAEVGIIGLLLFMAVIVYVFLETRKAQSTVHRAQNVIIDTRMTTNDARRANDHRMTTIDARSAIDAKHMTPQANDNSLIPSFFHSLIPITPSLISLLVMGLISFPFYSLPTLLIFFLLLAILSSNVNGVVVLERLTELSVFRNFSRVASFLSLTAISVMLFFMVRQQYKSFAAFQEAEMLYQIGSYAEACNSFSENYSLMSFNSTYLQYYGKALSMNEEYKRSIEILERSALYTSDEILYSNIGDSYKGLKRYTEAEKAYLHASFMVPHKLYPQYLLANLYTETGQNAKALETAEQVLIKEIKVKSTATEEIMQAMRKLVEKIKKDKIEFHSGSDSDNIKEQIH